VLDTLKPHADKIRVLLNKADTIDAQSLLRVYGALMWSLGKVVQTPEVCRVYLGSFWEAPLKLEENRQVQIGALDLSSVVFLMQYMDVNCLWGGAEFCLKGKRQTYWEK
jgi:hypothetical protein